VASLKGCTFGSKRRHRLDEQSSSLFSKGDFRGLPKLNLEGYDIRTVEVLVDQQITMIYFAY
jgi:hypothetical protein